LKDRHQLREVAHQYLSGGGPSGGTYGVFCRMSSPCHGSGFSLFSRAGALAGAVRRFGLAGAVERGLTFFFTGGGMPRGMS
jgi:hypothetical protein